MSHIELSATTTTTTHVELLPALKKKLLTMLTNYQQLHETVKAAEAEKKQLAKDIETVFVDAGEFNALLDGIDLDGFKMKIVHPVRHSLDKRALFRLITPAQYDVVNPAKPGAPYIKITTPGDDSDDDE